MKNKIILSISFLLSIAIFFFLGYFIGKTPITETTANKNQIQRDFLNNLRKEGILMPLPRSLKSIDGDVVKIGKNFIAIHPKQDRYINPLGATFPREMKFQLNQNTVFNIAHLKPQSQLAQEEKAYRAAVEKRDKERKSSNNLVRPDIFSYSPLGTKEVKTGDSVRIKTNTDILHSQGMITAVQVTLMNEIKK